MATQQTIIFNGALTAATENLSAQFESAIGFYLIAPGSTVEYQIDIYLQVELSNTITRMVRLEPSNISTTERITLLPPQLSELGLPMRLTIVPSEAFNLEVILLTADCGLCAIQTAMESNGNSENIEVLLNLILTYLGIPLPVVPQSISSASFSNLFSTGFI